MFLFRWFFFCFFVMFESNMVDLLESIFGGYKEVSQPSSNKSWWFVTSTENDLKGSNLKFIPLKTNMAIYIYMEKPTMLSRCISYGKIVGFWNVMLVFRGVTGFCLRNSNLCLVEISCLDCWTVGIPSLKMHQSLVVAVGGSHTLKKLSHQFSCY